ncbi:rRNA maturation RNase YbeY [Lentibacillus halophilus]|uniref:Endoribonuclease YbeY n=1 Tax=Lentibacillus halophilus TaxID=295065 RepID=A0ABP3J5Q8_9BACI
MHIDFQDETQSVHADNIDLLQRLLTFTAEKEVIASGAEVSVIFVNDKDIREINRNYRQQDKPTDVISFAMQETSEDETAIVGADLPLMLGDIVISIDRAREQAEEYEHSLERELGFLTVHGFLHLLGYDHMNDDDEARMFSKQDWVLGAFGLER